MVEVRKGVGLAIILASIVAWVYGAMNLYNEKVLEMSVADVPRVIEIGFVPILIGAALFIYGVTVQGYKTKAGLVVHTIANIPYFYAIYSVYQLGLRHVLNPMQYFQETVVFWGLGLALNVAGIVANQIGRKKPTVTPTG